MNYKFNEDKLIKELKEYVDKTYGQHYATDKYQATDIIIDSGHGTGFCLGNVIKYAKRYGNKGAPEDHRKDIMKILHYALIQLDVHDQAHPAQNSPEDTLDHGSWGFELKPGHNWGYESQQSTVQSSGLNSVSPAQWDAAGQAAQSRLKDDE